MSIEYSPALDRTTSGFSENASARGVFKERKPSQRRIDANRRNARKSTGPRTADGKRRASRNALKHGLCASTAVPSCEDLPTFNMHVDELRKEINPQTVLQKILFPQIAQLAWNLRRLPEAQAAMFQQELEKEPDSAPMTASQLLARRFSDESANGFALLGRYERASQAMFLRLLNQFHKTGKAAERKQRADPDERVPQEYVPAITPAQLVQQELAFERRKKEREQGIPPRNEREATMDKTLDIMAAQKKRTQSKPTENADSAAKTGVPEQPTPAPVTKRTQSDLVSSPPESLNSDRLASIQPSKEHP